MRKVLVVDVIDPRGELDAATIELSEWRSTMHVGVAGLMRNDERNWGISEWVQEIRFTYLPLYAANRLDLAREFADRIVALRHGVNANLLRHWMKLEHWPGQVPALLPVTIATEPACREAATATRAYPSSGTMEIELCGAVVRLSGEIDVAQLKTVLAVLRS